MTKSRLTVEDVDIDRSGFGILRAANVFARIGRPGVLNEQRTARFDAFLGHDADSTAWRIVANHLPQKIKVSTDRTSNMEAYFVSYVIEPKVIR